MFWTVTRILREGSGGCQLGRVGARLGADDGTRIGEEGMAGKQTKRWVRTEVRTRLCLGVIFSVCCNHWKTAKRCSEVIELRKAHPTLRPKQHVGQRGLLRETDYCLNVACGILPVSVVSH